MANPTMNVLADAAAEALSGQVHAGTGIVHQVLGASKVSTPTALANAMNQEENMLTTIGKAMAGLVISVGSGLNVGCYGIGYPNAGVEKSYAGDATVAMPVNETIHIYLDDAETIKQSTTGWPAGDHFKLAVVTTDATKVTGVVDKRNMNFQNGMVSNWWTIAPSVDLDMNGQGVLGIGALAGEDWTELTIAAGVVTPTQMLHTIDTEADASTDLLQTLTATAGANNRRIVVLRSADAARVVTIDSTTNITLSGPIFVMDSPLKYIAFIQDTDTSWVELFRNTVSILNLDTVLFVNANELNEIGKTTLNVQPATQISGGSIAASKSVMAVQNEGLAPTDELDTITGGSIDAFRPLMLIRKAGDAATLTIKHNSGNILLANGRDFVMKGDWYILVLRWEWAKSKWIEMSRSPMDAADLVGTGLAVPYTVGPVHFAGPPTIGVKKVQYHAVVPFTLKDATARAGTAPSGGACIVDILINGSSIFASQAEMMNIADGTTLDTSAVKNAAVAAGDKIEFEFEAVNGAGDVTLTLNGFAALQTPPG